MFTPELPPPILFHPLKHHLHYIRGFIQKYSHANEAELIAALQTIGSSQLDFYTGSLSPLQLSEEVILYLQQRRLLTPEVYLQHLAANGSDYQLLTLSDGTAWVLRWGVVAGRHVHLHPACYALNTIRVKANLLKTTIAVLLTRNRTKATTIDLQLVNQVRARWLDLPPVKYFGEDDGLAKLLDILR